MFNFGAHLKQLRKTCGVTQKQLALDIGASERGIQQYELGERKPTYDMLVVLADYFQVSVDYLTGRTDDPSKTLPIASGKHFKVCLNNLANNIKSFRAKHKMPQIEFAEACNISVETISLIERKKCSPRLDTLAAIADFMGVTVADLLN